MAIQPRLAARRLDHFDFCQRKNPSRFHTSDRLSGPYLEKVLGCKEVQEVDYSERKRAEPYTFYNLLLYGSSELHGLHSTQCIMQMHDALNPDSVHHADA